MQNQDTVQNEEGIEGWLNTMGRWGVPADPLFSDRASYQGKQPVGGCPDQRRSVIIA